VSKSAKVYHKHPVCNRLEKKAFERKILLHSNKDTREYNNVTTNPLSQQNCNNPRESFDCELSGMRWNTDGKRELFVINQEVSNIDT
jgi:hypothetical protein